MLTYANIFGEICSPENVFFAWDEFKRGKRNKLDVALFERDVEKHVFVLCRELASGQYRHAGYTDFWIHDPKRRHIHKATVRDRVLHHAVFRVLNPLFEPTFIANSFSCRVGKGTHKGVDVLARMLRKESRNHTRTCYALKCDVRKFFDSVNHEILLSLLYARITDVRVRALLTNIVRSYDSTPGSGRGGG